MQAQAPSSLLFFRSQPVGAITIDSPLLPERVLDNLRTRGKEWRESAVPEDLKKLKVSNLAVEVKGAEFEMFWVGNVSPFHNPVCVGIVQPYGDGSRIRAGFKLNARLVWLTITIVAAPVLAFVTDQSLFYGIAAGALLVTVIVQLTMRRGPEPMRTRLVEILSQAAT